ncbi:MAG: energy transducer TonB [Prevotellaceae bacterium]|nr:energy transducer TonB [Prevotellaceae bacterium]
MIFRKNVLLPTLLLCGFPVLLSAQKEPVNPDCGCAYTLAEQRFALEEEIMLVVDKPAQYRGGVSSLKRYEERMIQNPAQNASDSTKNSLLCRFVVERNGKISQVELLTHGDKVFEDEARRFISTMPRWIPAEKNGEKVRSWQSLRLYFGYRD